jgi:hypothetical protein
MLSNSNPRCHNAGRFSWLLMAFVLLLSSVAVLAQTTIGTASIQGTVTDPSGAVVNGAKVTITNKATQQVVSTASNSSGSFASGALIPGDYSVRAEAQGFKSVETPVVAQVGVTSTVNFKLTVGQTSETVEVTGAAIAVNTEQATVQGVLNQQQIEDLPVNGRNFLDLAQLEPGVQIQEGSTFDPTKNGYSSISFGGRFGRTARIEVDGVDVSDETVGTTTQNIPASSIQEFQLGESSLDISTELTSSGSVNVVTRSGTNSYHGELFGYYRNSAVGVAALPGGSSSPWEREQFGGNFGGAIIKDKLFFFMDVERSRQDLNNPIPLPAPFSAIPSTIGEPFRENEDMGRVDYQLSKTARAFYRFNYDENRDIRPFGAGPSLQPFLNHDNTPSHAAGVDFNTGSFTHAIRFEYLKFHNLITNGASEVTGAANPFPTATINIGGGAFAQCAAGGLFCSGPNLLAPQQTFQSDRQIKYDGSHIWASHLLRYGGGYNRIHGGGFASFFALSPTLSDDGSTPLPAGVLGSNGNPADPLNYPVQNSILGNGQGFFTEVPAFGYKEGGQHDNRIAFYFADTWKVKRNFTLTYGLRYVRDEGRSDSDLPAIPAVNAYDCAVCGENNLGAAVPTPSANFAPQIGFAWDPTGTGKTSIRGGAGLYYENAIFNNVLFDRPLRIPSGVFLATPVVCFGGGNIPFTWPISPGAAGTSIGGGAGVSNGNGTVSPTWCGDSIGMAAPLAVNLQNAYQAAAAAAPPSTNGSYFPNIIAGGGGIGPGIQGLSAFAPDYRTPRSVQMNIGIQHEIRPGLIFSADYLRNVSTRTLLAWDVNFGGAVTTFNAANAVADRDAAQTANGCAAGAGQVPCMIAALGAAGTLAAYGGAGIGGPLQITGGGACPFCAFPGIHPNLGVNQTNFPEGRSVYNGMDLVLKQQTSHFFVPGVKQANFQASYSLSRYVSQVSDSDFVNTATDYNNPDRFTGPNALDRKNQFSFGGTFDLPWFFQLGVIGHFYSPLPQSAVFSPSAGGPAAVLLTDVTGDGTVGDPVPGTQIGDFGRSFGVSGLQNVISNYNANDAGKATPAGNALIKAGVFTLADLQSFGGVMQPLANTVPGATGLGWLKTFDTSISWRYKVMERFTIEPRVGIFNTFNFANFDLPGNTQSGFLSFASAGPTQGPLTIGGTPYNFNRTNRAGLQSGTNALGAMRAIEWGLKLSF